MRKELGKKGAIELSMNTIIIVVIGVTLLTLGLRWVYSVFGGLTEQSKQIESVAQEQINELFGQSGDTIKLPASIITAQKGKTSEAQIFVRNILPNTQTYKYTVKPDEGTVPAGSIVWNKNGVKLKSGDAFKSFILIDTKNLALGTYSFSIEVACTDCTTPEEIPPAPLIIKVIPK